MKLDHKHVLQEFEDNWRGDSDNRRAALDDLQSLSGEGQWDPTDLNQRKRDGSPTLTINLLPQFVKQVANDIKQLNPSVDTTPMDGGTDRKLSEVFDGIIRQIEYQSKATSAYGHGGAMAVACGIGHWRIATDFVKDAVADQEIKIKRIMDPLSVVWDSASVEMDRSDAMMCDITAVIPQHEFKRRFPGADRLGQDVPQANTDHTNIGFWDHNDTVRIAERFYLQKKIKHLALTDDMETIDLTGLRREEIAFIASEVGIIRERKVDDFEVKHVTYDGNDFLGPVQDWAGRFIPIVPCMGDELAFDGNVVRSGMVRGMKDSQRAYNYWRSVSMEVITDTPKAPWLLTADQVKGYEQLWEKANKSNLPYLLYNQDPEKPLNKPQRERPADPPQAIWQEGQIAREELKGVSGIYDASLGARSNETSGVAINARERQGDTSNFNFIDNFTVAMHRTGEILVDLIPKIYDTDRVIQIIGKDESENLVPINKQVMGSDGEPIMLNDLSNARFNIRVRTGPSYATARAEAKDRMERMLNANPELWGVIGDLVFSHDDFPGSEEIAERIKRTIPEAIRGKDEADEDAEPEQPDPMQEIAQRLGLETAVVELALQKAKVAKLEAEVAETVADTKQTEVETLREMAEMSGAVVN